MIRQINSQLRRDIEHYKDKCADLKVAIAQKQADNEEIIKSKDKKIDHYKRLLGKIVEEYRIPFLKLDSIIDRTVHEEVEDELGVHIRYG